MECTTSSCANMGTCIQEWNSFRCDCDMTSFTGDTCAEGQYLGDSLFIRQFASVNARVI